VVTGARLFDCAWLVEPESSLSSEPVLVLGVTVVLVVVLAEDFDSAGSCPDASCTVIPLKTTMNSEAATAATRIRMSLTRCRRFSSGLMARRVGHRLKAALC
jgi:hypothetical protein